VVKCACHFAPGAAVAPALYFSRRAVPWGEGPLWHHIGVYAYRRAALERFVALPPSPLESGKAGTTARSGGRACGSRWRGWSTAPSAWTRRPTWNGRGRCWPGRTDDEQRQPPSPSKGLPGAYSDLACRDAYPGWTTLPCPSFEAAMDAVRGGQAALAMLPCENSLAGRVPDIHRLLPDSGLSVVGEHFERVEHCLLAPPARRSPP
jgi:hypothetical protein